jgi:hypothetical protein
MFQFTRHPPIHLFSNSRKVEVIDNTSLTVERYSNLPRDYLQVEWIWDMMPLWRQHSQTSWMEQVEEKYMSTEFGVDDVVEQVHTSGLGNANDPHLRVNAGSYHLIASSSLFKHHFATYKVGGGTKLIVKAGQRCAVATTCHSPRGDLPHVATVYVTGQNLTLIEPEQAIVIHNTYDVDQCYYDFPIFGRVLSPDCVRETLKPDQVFDVCEHLAKEVNIEWTPTIAGICSMVPPIRHNPLDQALPDVILRESRSVPTYVRVSYTDSKRKRHEIEVSGAINLPADARNVVITPITFQEAVARHVTGVLDEVTQARTQRLQVRGDTLPDTMPADVASPSFIKLFGTYSAEAIEADLEACDQALLRLVRQRFPKTVFFPQISARKLRDKDLRLHNPISWGTPPGTDHKEQLEYGRGALVEDVVYGSGNTFIEYVIPVFMVT